MDSISTHDRILASAKRLLAEQGFSDISMQQIADEVEVTKAALYHFFPAKEDIYVAVMQELLLSAISLSNHILDQELPADEQFRLLIHEHFRFGLENRTVLQFWDLAVMKIQEDKRNELCGLHQQLKNILKTAFERNEVKDPDLAVLVMMSSLLRFLKMCKHPHAPDAERFAQYLVDLFLAR